eukprot:1534609-Pyramimonas_sp.AAC.1
MVEKECGVASERSDPGRVHLERDGRRAKRPRVIAKNPAFLYGMRPLDAKWAPELRYLSVYELFPILANRNDKVVHEDEEKERGNRGRGRDGGRGG